MLRKKNVTERCWRLRIHWQRIHLFRLLILLSGTLFSGKEKSHPKRRHVFKSGGKIDLLIVKKLRIQIEHQVFGEVHHERVFPVHGASENGLGETRRDGAGAREIAA